MISLICENCKETQTSGTGRWVADNGNVTFYCGACEGRLLVAALKGAKPKAAKRAPRSTNGRAAEAVAASN